MTGSLLDKRIVNTRALHQAAELDQLLRDRGATPLSYPCLAIVPPLDPAPLDAALADLIAGRFDWLALTSANAVHAVALRLATRGLSLPYDPGFKTAAIGQATAEMAAAELRLQPGVVPAEGRGEALALAIPDVAGARVLLPVSDIARPEPAALLRERGADVTSAIAYRTVIDTGGVDVPRLLATRQIDAVTFASPSAVDGFVRRLQREGAAFADLQNVAIACLGPTTRDAALSRGFGNPLMPESPTLSGLVESLEVALRPTAGGVLAW
ncbi:MAG: hypothetical protein QOG89_1061 [Thermomicrobiales bacterium]|nr:hypothetical protein [Thermomicrobiales bacterium]